MTPSPRLGGTAATRSENGGPEPDRRTRKRELRRDEVYRAAVELFIEQGFDNTTMDQIAEHADVARATVFNYFPRKTAFLDEWTARRRHRAAAAVHEEDLADWSLDEILTRYMAEMAKISDDTRAETVALMAACLHSTNLLAHPALGHQLATFVRDAQRSGEAPLEMDAEQAGVLTAIAYFAVLSQWIAEEPAPFDLHTELLAMLDLVLYGIFTSRDATPERRRRGQTGGRSSPRSQRQGQRSRRG
jgi:AcrR family transcriptional regulator